MAIKTIKKIKLIAIGIAVSITVSSVKAQFSSCGAPTKEKFLYANDVKTKIRNAGDMFWDGTRAQFIVPANAGNILELSTIFNSNLWLTARNSAGQLLSSYSRDARCQIQIGPIVAQTRLPDSDCDDWNRIFSVSSCEVNNLQADYSDNQVLNQTPSPNILSWPGKGNPFFQSQMGFALPNQALAPFFDRNNDGTYNPYDGDYPAIKINWRFTVPAQLMWMVINDLGIRQSPTGGTIPPLGAQIAMTAYSFKSPELYQEIFLRYEVTNFGGTRLDSLRFGIVHDPDLGCERDDYVGAHTATNTAYIYNSAAIDPVSVCSSDGYGTNPPVQAISFVDKPLTSFTCFFASGTSPNPNMSEPQIAQDLESYMSGRWKDGSPMYAAGNGYQQTGAPTTFFAFEGNPNDPNQHSMLSARISNRDIRMLQSITVSGLEPDSTFNVDVMYSFHREDSVRSATPNLDNVTLMMSEVPSLLQFYRTSNLASPPCPSDVVWPGDTDANGKVDFRDYLNIAVANGVSVTGNARQRYFTGWNGENAPADWQAQSLNLPNQLNIKHADCSGDGVINMGDYHTVYQNFKEKNREVADDYGSNAAGLSLVRYYSPTLFPISDSICRIRPVVSSAVPEMTHTSNNNRFLIRLSPTIDLYGLAFELEYDPLMIEALSSLVITPINTVAFPSPIGSNYFNTFINHDEGVVSYVIFNTDGTAQPLSSGNVGSFWFRLAVRRPFNYTAAVDSLFFRFKNIRGVRADGSIIALGSQDGVLFFSENPPVGIDTEPGIATFELTPNPSDGQIRLETDGRDAGTASVSVCNMLGQEVHRQALDGSSTSLSLQHLPQGVYLVNILGGEVRYAPQKVVIQR